MTAAVPPRSAPELYWLAIEIEQEIEKLPSSRARGQALRNARRLRVNLSELVADSLAARCGCKAPGSTGDAGADLFRSCMLPVDHHGPHYGGAGNRWEAAA